MLCQLHWVAVEVEAEARVQFLHVFERIWDMMRELVASSSAIGRETIGVRLPSWRQANGEQSESVRLQFGNWTARRTLGVRMQAGGKRTENIWSGL